MAVVTELVTKFGFQGSTKPLEGFNAGLGSAIAQIGKVTAVIGIVKSAVDAFVIGTLSGADAQQQLAKETGVSVEKIQELGYAASVSGSSTQALENTMGSLSQKIGEAAQKGSEDFARLGISVRSANGQVKTADQILGEVGNRFKTLNLSLSEQKSFASSLGIDSSLIQMLNKTGSEMAALQSKARALGVITTAQSDKIINFNDSITTLKFGLSAIQKQVAIGLSPAIKNTAEGFTDFLVANKELVQQGISKVVEIVQTAFQAIKRLGTFIYNIIEATIGWKAALIAIGVVLAVVASPVTIISALIIGLLAIIDDLIVAFHGGKSVIADFFQEFFGIDIQPILQNLVDGFDMVVERIKVIGGFIVDYWKGLFQIITAIFRGDFSGAFDGLKKAAGAIVDIIKNIFGTVFESILSQFNKIGNVVSKVKGFFGFGDSSGPDASTQNITPGNTSSQSVTSNNNVSQNVTIEIKTDNPTAAGQSVADSLQEQLNNARTQAGKGGM